MRIETGYVKLAQLHNLAGTQNKKKYELADQLDINYSVPDEFESMKTMKKILSGYTLLHISVMRFDVELTLDLLQRHANVLKQGTFDEWTPLHLALYNTKIEEQMIWDVFGALQEQLLMDILLTAHVNTRNTLNPTCKQGVSHLHIACICNHAEAIRFLANENLVNQAAGPDSHWPGYTALHFAVRYSSTEAVEILMRNKADMHVKDVKGMSPLQLMIDRMIDLTDSLTFGKPPNYLLIDKEMIMLQELKLRAEADRLKDIIVLALRVESAKSVNYSEQEALVIFHAHCVQQSTSILRNFLATNVNLNSPVTRDSPFWPGWTPLHFAACCNVEAVKLLVGHGADLNVKNAEGETAMDFCLKKYSPAVIHDILSMDKRLKDILLTDGTTKLLDVILLMSDCDKFNNFLQTVDDTNISVPLDSPLWPGYSLLHLAVRMNEVPTRIVCQDLNDSVFGIRYCFEDFHVVTENQAITFWQILCACLSKGCSLTTKDANGQSPIHLAFHLRKTMVVAELIKVCREDAVDPSGLSHLHVACALDRPLALTAIKQLHSANINSRVKSPFEWHNESPSRTAKPRLIKVQANSTALHIAVAFKNERAVEYLLKSGGADVHARDALGQTPIHLSMSSTKSISRLLLENAPNLTDDSASDEGLSYLHVAAFANDDLSIRKFLRTGRAETDVEYRGGSPLHVAVVHDSDKAVRQLLRLGGERIVDEENPLDAYDTPLDRVTRTLSSGSVEYFYIHLKYNSCQVFSNGITALHFACAICDRKWARLLLEKGADANARVCDAEDYHGAWKGFTALHVLIRRARENREGLRYLQGMMEVLMKYGADGMIANRDGCTPIMMALDALTEANERRVDAVSGDREHWVSAVDMLFKNIRKYDFNPVNSDGLSLFHCACSLNKAEVVERFLRKGVDVNLTMDPFGKYKGYTPLHAALYANAEIVARLLILFGADVKAEDADGRTPLHFAILWTSMEDLWWLETLVRNGADANAKDLEDQTAMDCLLKSERLTGRHLEFLRKNGSTADVSGFLSVEGSLGLAMKKAYANNDGGSIFQTLIEICDLKSAIADGFNAIHSLVAVTSYDVISTKTYLDCIGQLMDLGYELDQQDEEGNTALHKAAHFYNVKAIRVLLALGADINIVDEDNVTPFMTAYFDLVKRSINCDMQLKSLAKTAFVGHVWMMNVLGLHLNSDIRELLGRVTINYSEEQLQEELATQNSMQCGGPLCLGDFMSEMKAVAAYPRMLSCKREVVDYYFSRTAVAGLRKKFPLTVGVLTMQFRKARARKGLLERSKVVMGSLWPSELPDLCAEAILEYLSNDELKILIDDADDSSNPRKRRRLQ